MARIDPASELHGNGLHLRAYRADDAPALLAAVRESIDTVGRWLPWCHAQYGEADAHAWIAHCAEGWRDDEHYAFAVFDAATATLCGAVGLNQRNRAHKFINLGYWVRASRQREGIAVRAAALIAAFGFERLKLARIEIVTTPDNLASQRVAAALGAVYEGVARNRIMVHGQAADALMYSLLPGDIRPVSANLQGAAQTCSTSS